MLFHPTFMFCVLIWDSLLPAWIRGDHSCCYLSFTELRPQRVKVSHELRNFFRHILSSNYEINLRWSSHSTHVYTDIWREFPTSFLMHKVWYISVIRGQLLMLLPQIHWALHQVILVSNLDLTQHFNSLWTLPSLREDAETGPISVCLSSLCWECQGDQLGVPNKGPTKYFTWSWNVNKNIDWL